MRSYFIPMKEEIILCISLQITCLRKISVCSDFVTFKGAVGYSPIPPSPPPRRIAHLSSLRHLAFPKLMDFQNPVRGPAVLVAVNCQRGQACSCACGDDLITFTEVGRPTHYGWHLPWAKNSGLYKIQPAGWAPAFPVHCLLLTAQPCDQLLPEPWPLPALTLR